MCHLLVMVGQLVGWSVSRLVGWLLGALVAWLVGWLVGWLVDCWIGQCASAVDGDWFLVTFAG